MSQTPNPFCNRGVITDPDDFFGRETQIAEIITRLGTLQSTSVVGERRIGKSSLLYHLCQTGVRRLNDASYRFCYVDLQDAHYHTAVGFFQTVLHKLEVAADAVKPDNSLNGNLVAFTDQIDALERTGQRLVFCLDEFENTFKHRDEFSEDFFDHMRAQLNTRKMALVTATQRGLQTLSLELSFLAAEDARELITEPVPLLQYESGIIEQIIEMTHCQPYLLQAVASDLVNYLNAEKRMLATAADLEVAVEKVLVTVQSYFFYTWTGDCTEPEREVLRAIATGDRNSHILAERQASLQSLCHKEILERQPSGYRFSIELFRRWVLKNQTAQAMTPGDLPEPAELEYADLLTSHT